MKEKWIQICQIQGFEEIKDCYWISNSDEDKIINTNTGKQLKICIDNHGYPMVSLMTIEGKYRTYKIHIIKAKAFLFGPNPLNATLVRHLDDCKTNNALTNLVWGTQSDNMRDCIRNGNYNYNAAIRGLAKGGAMSARKFSKPVKCLETGVIYASAKEAERQTGINNGNINACCNGERKTAGGYHWKFVDKEVDSNELECE